MHLVFCPYLRLRGPLKLGSWSAVPVSQYTGTWAVGLERVARQFLRAFYDSSEHRIADPTLIVHSVRGVDGSIPKAADWKALQQALDFAVINSNAYQFTGDGSSVSTSDNSEIFVWPIDVAKKRLAVRHGLLVKVTTGGLVIGPQLRVDAPPDLHMPFTFRVESPDFVDALFKVLARQATPRHQSIATAIHWLAKAWRNSSSINWDDRLVMIKTAFEALTGSSKTHIAAARLRALFEGTQMTRREASRAEFLWKPSEKATRIFDWTDGGGHVHHFNVTTLEHWFRTFGEARNTIIHDGVSPLHVYRARRSAYNGPFFFVAQRVLREAIRVEVARLKGREWMFSDEERRNTALIARIVKKYEKKKKKKKK